MSARWLAGHHRGPDLRTPWVSLPIFIHVSVLVGLHLGEAEDCVLTLSAVVMGLLPIVTAAGRGTILGGSELLEARGQDGVQLLVLPPVRYHLVGIGAVVVALQAVEVARALLICTCSGETELDARL